MAPVQTVQIIEFSIRNDLSDMVTASTTLDSIGERFTVPAKVLMQLQIALDEALSNIIKYAWPEGGEHKVQVQVMVEPDHLQIEIIDDGQPFDPRLGTVKKPKAQQAAYGGRGISMIKQLVDRVEYARIDEHNHLIIIKKIARSWKSQTTDG